MRKSYKLFIVLITIFTIIAGIYNCSPNNKTEEYNLSITITPDNAGTVAKDPDKEKYDKGEVVTLTAKSNDGYVFDHWNDDTALTDSVFTVTMDGDQSVTANFRASSSNTWTLNVSTSEGGSVTIEPNQTTFNDGESVRLTAVPDTDNDYIFDNWNNDTTLINPILTLTMNEDKIVKANFKKKVEEEKIYTLDITVTPANMGNSVTKSPDQEKYANNEVVTLTAVPGPDYVFDHWNDDTNLTNTTYQVTMTDNISVTATFRREDAEQKWTLTVNNSDGGTVDISPSGPDYTSGYPDGTEITLTANADVDHVFDHWNDDTALNNFIYKFTITSDTSITPHFRDKTTTTHTLTVTATAGGSVTIEPNQTTFNDGDSVKLTAVPDNKYEFLNWNDDANLTDIEITIVMNENKTYNANFGEYELIKDVNLRPLVATAAGKPYDDLTKEDLATIIDITKPETGTVEILTIEGLEHCTSLEILNLRVNKISDLTPLKDLTTLKKIDMSLNKVVDISPLSGLVNLEDLDLMSNELNTNLDALVNLSKMVNLRLSNNDNLSGDLDGLKNMLDLKDLKFANGQISSLAGLEKLTKLEVLNFGNNNISDLAPLENLTSLKKLIGFENGITATLPLKKLVNLTELDLKRNNISNLSGLEDMVNLTHLYLFNNLVTDISSLSSLNKMKFLHLSSKVSWGTNKNAIASLYPLKEMYDNGAFHELPHLISTDGNGIDPNGDAGNSMTNKQVVDYLKNNGVRINAGTGF